MAETEYYNDAQGRQQSRVTKSRSEVEGNVAGAASGTTAGKGLGAKGKSGEGMPQLEPGENALSPSYRNRVREWRERGARAGAVKDMLKR